jgi:hypothetical protein
MSSSNNNQCKIKASYIETSKKLIILGSLMNRQVGVFAMDEKGFSGPELSLQVQEFLKLWNVII